MPDSGSDMFGNTEYFGASARPGEGDSVMSPGDSSRGQTLVEHYNAHYGRYIDLADQLRTFGLEKEIPLPQVVVIGIQSSGKSSVLESISGVPLPRGTGTVTRTAVELRLHHTAAGRWAAELKCENDAGEEHKVTLGSPAEVSEAIKTATVFLAGENGISDRATIVDIWADNVPDLTLIDLPGLIEMPMEGQPADICERIEALVLKYISKMEALILVVVAGNSEIATTKALKLAKTADPDGRRTIGVITKVDLVPGGTEQDIVRMVCEPAKYKIQKGFVLVKLRSKEDIDHQVTLQQNAENEARFFLSQTHYRALPESTLGTNSLSNKLTWELVERIKTVLPSLKEETQKRMKDTEVELRMMGEGIPRESKEQRKYIAQKFLDFTKKLTRNCDGLYELEDANDMRLLLQTRPAMEAFAEAVNKLMPAASNEELVERVKEEIRNQRGEELPHFLPYRACQVVVSGLLKEYTVPAMKCLNDYNVIVDNFLRRLSEQYFAYFPRMENEIKLVIDELRTKAFDVCEAAIKDIFEIEYMVIIPDKLFFKMEANEPKCYSSLGSVEVDDRKSTEKLIQFLMGEREPDASQPPIQDNGNNGSTFTIRQIIIYFKSALDRITATVPMRIHYNLVRMLSRTIECQVTSMALDPEVVNLLMEDEATAKIRGDLEGKLECLRRSYAELTRF